MNPIHNAILLRSPKAPGETPHYTAAEMGAALAALRSEPKARAIMALAFVGLDRSEIRGLMREDVDLVNNIVRVRRGVTGTGKLDTKDVHEGAKAKNRRRDVTIGQHVSDIIRAYTESTPESKHGWLFENEKGNALELGLYSTRVLRPLFEKAELTWKGFHAGRRGAETEMGRSTNGDTQVTMHHFGHTKEVADAHYMKPIPEKTVVAALALDDAIGAAMQKCEKEAVVVQ
jgi:integrase